MNFVIKGQTYKAQLTVHDVNNKISFAVFYLPATAKKNTPFKGAGKKAYYGTSFDAAVGMLIRLAGKDAVVKQLPKSVLKFKDANKESFNCCQCLGEVKEFANVVEDANALVCEDCSEKY